MVENFLKPEETSVHSHSWCVEWFGSQGDFIAGQSTNPVSLNRFAGLESLYAVGPLEKGRGEVSIFDSLTLISQVNEAKVDVLAGHDYHAGFLVYAIVENWRRATDANRLEKSNDSKNNYCPLPLRAVSTSIGPFRSWSMATPPKPCSMFYAIKATNPTVPRFMKNPKSAFR